MAQWQDGYVQANGIRIHYTRTGGDKPPVVLCHGSTDSGLCWTPVARALEADYDVVMPDARGHGLSDAPDGGYDHATRADDLAAFIQALGLDRPVVGGHSMGASQTLAFAAAYPDALRAAILEDGGIRMPGWNPPNRGAPDAALRLKEMTREQLIAFARERHPTWAEEELGPWADAKLQVSLKHVNAPRSQLDFRELLPKVTVPILLITSDPERGGGVTPEAAEEAKRIHPDTTVVRLSPAGHNVRREQFAGFVEAVRAFLRQHAGAAPAPAR
ncbi:MAG TPA: alpha/beta hydrolase [Chloroflexota bacterium]|jgi:pimeloyl-ACP methyl ester carboxylesterase|nr:alpha/beta hydrolase [Chloroflexota bacterium]